MPHVPGVRTVRKLLVGLGIGLAFITVFSVFALIYLFRLNAVVRHVAFDPVPGSAAIASVAKDFNQYRVLEAMGRRAAESWGMSLTRKAADIERDLKAYDATITQRDDRRRFTELVALWSSYRGLQGETAARSEPAPPAEMALMPARQERAYSWSMPSKNSAGVTLWYFRTRRQRARVKVSVASRQPVEKW